MTKGVLLEFYVVTLLYCVVFSAAKFLSCPIALSTCVNQPKLLGLFYTQVVFLFWGTINKDHDPRRL